MRKTLGVLVLLSGALAVVMAAPRRLPPLPANPGVNGAAPRQTVNPRGKPLTATVDRDGTIRVRDGDVPVATIAPGMHLAGWQGVSVAAVPGTPPEPTVRRGRMAAPSGDVAVESRIERNGPALHIITRMTPTADLMVNSARVSVDLPASEWVPALWTAAGRSGRVELSSTETSVWSGETRTFSIVGPGGRALSLTSPAALPVLLQDSRRWSPSLEVRLGANSGEPFRWAAGETRTVDVTLAFDRPVRVVYDAPVTMKAGPNWTPLTPGLDPVPGSALDWSRLGLQDAPAGKHGWLTARPDGQFAFEKRPNRAVRFYGVNLAFSAHYLTREQADRLADRLARIGYNTLRIHHHEGELLDPSDPTRQRLNPEKLDQLDYLVAACKRRGLYITTDLFVSRPIREGLAGPGRVEMDEYKTLVPVSAEAMADWKAFSRALLTHVNPHTGLAWKDDPAIPLLSMVNEGNVVNFAGSLSAKARPLWQAAFNRWLAARYPNRDALAAAWGGALAASEDAGRGSVTFRGGAGARDRDYLNAIAEIQRAAFDEQKRFVREELGCRALLTDLNAWSNTLATQASRSRFDYVDNHFYWDHPVFLERPWSLPSRNSGGSALNASGAGPRDVALTRLYDKPFTLTEFNFSGPTPFRGEGGLLTGAVAALQNWSGLWRFAYSHSRDNLFQPAPMGYFDVATDPMTQASERAALLLFLRGDVRVARPAVALAAASEEVAAAGGWLGGGLSPLALVTRIGSYVGERPWPSLTRVSLVNPPPLEEVLNGLRRSGQLPRGNRTDPGSGMWQSATGQITLDARAGSFVVSTPRTAGLVGPAGAAVRAGACTFRLAGSRGAVWASALDLRPLSQSRRILLTHLTDAQNTGARFADSARTTLEAWGGLPHLVRSGTARVTLRSSVPLRAWALAMDGRRIARLPLQRTARSYVLNLNTRGPQGARLYYELAAR